jgi:hypothetical protein
MSWNQTFSGKDFDFEHLCVDDVSLVDIAHSLGLQCRFNGHCKQFYSVAEHSYWASIRAADLAAAKVRSGEINQKHGVAITVTALFHDAAESYIGDMVRPLKKLPGMELFSEIEGKIIGLIQRKYGFPIDPVTMALVKQADNEMLAIEQRDLMNPCARAWSGVVPIPDPSFVEIECWTPEVAEARWLRTARALGTK